MYSGSKQSKNPNLLDKFIMLWPESLEVKLCHFTDFCYPGLVAFTLCIQLYIIFFSATCISHKLRVTWYWYFLQNNNQATFVFCFLTGTPEFFPTYFTRKHCLTTAKKLQFSASQTYSCC